MNKRNDTVDRIKIGLGIVLLAILTGCVGYVDGGYGGAVVVPGPGVVVVPEPDVYVFGGGYYERGRDVHDYSHRGSESRAVAHPESHGTQSRPSPARPAPPSAVHSGGGEKR